MLMSCYENDGRKFLLLPFLYISLFNHSTQIYKNPGPVLWSGNFPHFYTYNNFSSIFHFSKDSTKAGTISKSSSFGVQYTFTPSSITSNPASFKYV